MRICVVGLGYVGLPLALEISKYYETIGYDCNDSRISELTNLIDINGEYDLTQLSKDIYLKYTNSLTDQNYFYDKTQTIYIICVPTPVYQDNTPNLEMLDKAIFDVSKVMNEKDVIIFESTIYPGCVEEYCIPILSELTKIEISKLNYGYSPERINPGDQEHTILNVTKVISASNDKTINVMKEIYGNITKNNIYIAENIKTAEIGKLLENIQRDINIALMNQISLICEGLDIKMYDVLETCKTKWNFLDFKPGLVGGHCVSVDPHYLIFQAKRKKLDHDLISTARDINDRMVKNVVRKILMNLTKLEKYIEGEIEILFLGLAFKENVKDTRNSLILNVINEVSKIVNNVHITASDPIVESEYIALDSKVTFCEDKVLLESKKKFHIIIVNNKHDIYFENNFENYKNLLTSQGSIIDLTMSGLDKKL